MPYLTKQQILEAQDRKTVDVEVPEWGGTVRVKTMTGVQRDQYETLFTSIRNGEVSGSIRATLAAATIVDEEGNQLFTKDEVDSLGQKSGVALGRVFDVAAELNVATKKSAETVAGNS